MFLCTDFSYVSFKGDKDTLVCGSDKVLCYGEAQDTVLEGDFSKNCHCLPACTSLNYDAEISQAKFDKANSLIAQRYEGSKDELIGYAYIFSINFCVNLIF